MSATIEIVSKYQFSVKECIRNSSWVSHMHLPWIHSLPPLFGKLYSHPSHGTLRFLQIQHKLVPYGKVWQALKRILLLSWFNTEWSTPSWSIFLGTIETDSKLMWYFPLSCVYSLITLFSIVNLQHSSNWNKLSEQEVPMSQSLDISVISKALVALKQ